MSPRVRDLKTQKPPFGGFGIHRSVVKNISAARLSVKVAAQIFEKTTAGMRHVRTRSENASASVPTQAGAEPGAVGAMPGAD
jgi:hypothetical protein